MFPAGCHRPDGRRSHQEVGGPGTWRESASHGLGRSTGLQRSSALPGPQQRRGARLCGPQGGRWLSDHFDGQPLDLHRFGRGSAGRHGPEWRRELAEQQHRRWGPPDGQAAQRAQRDRVQRPAAFQTEGHLRLQGPDRRLDRRNWRFRTGTAAADRWRVGGSQTRSLRSADQPGHSGRRQRGRLVLCRHRRSVTGSLGFRAHPHPQQHPVVYGSLLEVVQRFRPLVALPSGHHGQSTFFQSAENFHRN